MDGIIAITCGLLLAVFCYWHMLGQTNSGEVVIKVDTPLRIDPKAIPHGGPWYIKTDDDDVNMAFFYYNDEKDGGSLFSIWASCETVPANRVLWVRQVPDLDAMPIVTGSETQPTGVST